MHPTEPQLISHQRTGNKVPLRERPYDFWAQFIKLEIQPTDTLDLFIRLDGADQHLSFSHIPFVHIDKSSVFPQQVNEGWRSGLFYGILGSII